MRVRIALLAAGLLLAGGVSAAQAMPGPDFFGTNVQPMVKLQVVTPDRWGTFLARQSADGMKVARADAAWAWAEPTPPVNGVHTYSWDRPDNPNQSLDRMVGALAAQGVRLSAVVSTAPGWAGGGGRLLTPDHFGDLAAFAGAFAARYGTGGTFWAAHPELAALPVRDYEIWTEGNSTNSWSGTVDPADYLAGLRPVSAAIHAADPAGRVLASLGWDGYQPYLAQLYAGGMKGVVDGIAFHPYGFRPIDILGLVSGMRAALVADGDPSLPIFATELGFPAPDAATDARRAGSLSLAGDVLARSDCGVQDMLTYASVTGEADNANEPIGEAYMGIYRKADALPNATGAALAAAALRWRASPSTGVVVCGAGATPARALLPLGLTLTHDSPRCVTAHGSYAGNPVEGLQIVMRTPWGPVGGALTDATGSTQVCMASWAADDSFEVHAEIDNVAQSGIFTCVVGPARCTIEQPPPAFGGTVAGGIADPGTGGSSTSSGAGSASGGTGSGTGVAATCAYKLRVRIVKVRPAKTTARISLRCSGHQLAAVRATMLIQRKGSRTQTSIGRVRLAKGKATTVTLKRRLRVGDRLIVRQAKSTTTGIPSLVAKATATRALGAR